MTTSNKNINFLPVACGWGAGGAVAQGIHPEGIQIDLATLFLLVKTFFNRLGPGDPSDGGHSNRLGDLSWFLGYPNRIWPGHRPALARQCFLLPLLFSFSSESWQYLTIIDIIEICKMHVIKSCTAKWGNHHTPRFSPNFYEISI